MFPTFTIQTRDRAYIYNPWSNGSKEVHNSDYTHSKKCCCGSIYLFRGYCQVCANKDEEYNSCNRI